MSTCIWDRSLSELNEQRNRGYLIFFSVRSNLISLMNTKTCISTHEKHQIFLFLYAFSYNNQASTCSSTLTSEHNLFSSHFASIPSCSSLLSENAVLRLENELK